MFVLAIVVALFASGIARAQGLTAEDNIDRPGADYRSFDLPQPGWELCRNACASDGHCQAYTFVRPGVQGPNARCWLKSSVPAPVQRGCCVSGVRSTGGAVPGGHWRLAALPSFRNLYPPTQPPAYHVDRFEANARGGLLRVTVFGTGQCAPNAGMATPGTSQTFLFRWIIHQDASALRIGDQVAIDFQAEGSSNQCMQLNPFMTIGGPQRNVQTSDARHRHYTFPALTQPGWHVGGARTVRFASSHLGPRDEFEIVISGFRVPLDLHIQYPYVWVP